VRKDGAWRDGEGGIEKACGPAAPIFAKVRTAQRTSRMGHSACFEHESRIFRDDWNGPWCSWTGPESLYWSNHKKILIAREEAQRGQGGGVFTLVLLQGGAGSTTDFSLLPGSRGRGAKRR
jgi:hypothetical protein